MIRRTPVARTMAALRRGIEKFRRAGDTVALVPTMGALHEGHLALVRLAQRKADRTVVSIFVNPAQFAPHEDLATYPRTFAKDLAALSALKTDLVWAPSSDVMYPPGFATRIAPEGPALAGLEDAFRPHFFGGVATVVVKLLVQCLPDIAVFGEKDYQQLKVVTQMVKDLDIPTRIVGAPIVREKDGLAMSSRNAYLSAGQRQVAPVLYRALRQCADAIKRGDSIPAALADGRAMITAAGFVLDYLEARDAGTLQPVDARGKRPIRLLVAARLGATRLIDNIGV